MPFWLKARIEIETLSPTRSRRGRGKGGAPAQQSGESCCEWQSVYGEQQLNKITPTPPHPWRGKWNPKANGVKWRTPTPNHPTPPREGFM